MTDITNNTNKTNDMNGNEAKIDMSYIFRQIAAIQEQTEYLHMAIENLSMVTDGSSGEKYSPGDIAGQAKAKAFGDIVRCREVTNQQILRFYETVYNDLKTGVFDKSVPEVPSVFDKPLPEVPSVFDKPLPEVPSVFDKPLPEVPSVFDKPLPEVPSVFDKPLPEVPSVLKSYD